MEYKTFENKIMDLFKEYNKKVERIYHEMHESKGKKQFEYTIIYEQEGYDAKM